MDNEVQMTLYGGPEVLTYTERRGTCLTCQARPSCSLPHPASTTWTCMAAPTSMAPARIPVILDQQTATELAFERDGCNSKKRTDRRSQRASK